MAYFTEPLVAASPFKIATFPSTASIADLTVDVDENPWPIAPEIIASALAIACEIPLNPIVSSPITKYFVVSSNESATKLNLLFVESNWIPFPALYSLIKSLVAI